MVIRYATIEIELSEYQSIKLSPIISSEHSRNTKPTNDVPLYKILYLFLHDYYQWLGLRQLGETIHHDNYKPDLGIRCW